MHTLLLARRVALFTCWFLGLFAVIADAAEAPWKVGVATRKLTPPGPIWMAGYAGRAAPSSGVDQDIFGKALFVQDASGGRIAIVTLDLIGVTAELRAQVERECARRAGLEAHEILLNVSHTHCGPEVRPDRMVLERVFRRAAKPADVEAVHAYERALRETVVELVLASMADVAPATLDFGQARAGFAMNRRRPEPDGTVTNNPNPAGPVDHDVPVLKATGEDGKVRALLFGYACHNTTMAGEKISGDYAGHAQRILEDAFEGATALFVSGCGGDQNPYPRRTMMPGQTQETLAEQHGRALANAVATAVTRTARPRPVRGPLRAALAYAELEYTAPAPAALLQGWREPEFTAPVVARARELAAQLERGEKLAPQRCPVQVVRFGGDLGLVAIGGEVVVDYALRLKRELAGPAAVWVAGYSNDVFGYLGSRRVIEEGGYEGGEANTRILKHPGAFRPAVEDVVVETVVGLWRTTGGAMTAVE